MNSALVMVLVAAAGGVASLFALRSLAPSASPAVALVVMATALLGAAWRQRRA